MPADLYHSPDFDLPEFSEPCPPDAVSLIEEFHEGLHKVMVSKQERRGSYKPIATVICQEGGDKRSRPGANPDEIAEYVMALVQFEIEKNDDPGVYKMELVGPSGKGRFQRSKHIDMRGDDGAPRSISQLSEGDLLEQQSAYIGELHSQLIGMMELVTSSHRQLTNENREMMKIVSDAARKNAEIERDRLRHQLEVRIHEDEVKFAEEEAGRSMEKWQQGIDAFKNTGAAEEFMRVIARKLDRFGEKAPPPEFPQISDEKKREAAAAAEAAKKDEEGPAAKKTSKKAAKKKAKKSGKGSIKRTGAAEEPAEPKSDEEIDAEILDEGRRMVQERPLVMAAEALKMSIDENNQWGIIRKTLTDEQADFLDDIIASTTDEDVIANAHKLYNARGLKNLMTLNDHLDDQQKRFIAFILSRVT